MRKFLIAAAILLTACAPAPPPQIRDITKEPWYGPTVDELADMNREAAAAYAKGDADKASALILKGQPLVAKILAAPHPPLEATVAASDLDTLYGRMLLANKHYGWARMQFQKDYSRWKHWQPKTEDSERRLKLDGDAIDECDKHLPE